MLKSQRLVIYEVTAPMDRRLQRSGITDLQTFCDHMSSYERVMQGDQSIPIENSFHNDYETVEEFYAQLFRVGYNFADKTILRPTWDKYFMQLAHLVSKRTNCMKRAVGCVIVKENRIVATGYNGTPFGMENCNEGGCDRCNQNTPSGAGLCECFCIHAEENAVIEGGRAKTQGGTAYVTTYPCLMCAKKLVQAGIARIVYDRDYDMPITKNFFAKLSVQVDHYPIP